MSVLSKHKFGISGIVIGFIAIIIAATQENIRDHFTKESKEIPAKEESLKDLALQAGKKLIKEKILKQPSTENRQGEKRNIFNPSEFDLSDKVNLTFYTLGFIAIFLSIISFLKKENIRVSAICCACGLIAIAWSYVLIGVAIAVLILIIGSISA